MTNGHDESALRRAYDPEQFRSLGHALIDRLADYLAAATRGGEDLPVRPPTKPGAVLASWPADFARELHDAGAGDLADLFGKVLDGAHHLHHPRSFGHQMPAVLPLAPLCNLLVTLLNNSAAVFEMGPVATAVETRVVRWMCDALGYGPGADGLLTSGGSVGNLTALLAMRQARAGHDLWREGQRPGDRFALLVSEQAHYCIARAVQILGWGREGIVEVPTDERFRMRLDALASALQRTRDAGRRPLAVVASACSTATGAIDPLDPIADFCAERSLWMHVDGAHGASLVLSSKHRALLRGIDRADSVVWDAHKTLLMPALSTGVLFRDGTHAGATFAQEASYLFVPAEGEAAPDPANTDAAPDLDLGHRTIECTKPALGLPLYVALRAYGTGMFGDYLTRCVDLAAHFADHVETASDFELAARPDANMVCFRYTPTSASDSTASDLDAVQTRARNAILGSGRFYITQTRLRGSIWLRCTLLNPHTRIDDLDALLCAIRATR